MGESNSKTIRSDKCSAYVIPAHPESLPLRRRSMSSTQTFFGGCPHDCPDTCAMLYTAQDGRLIEVKGNADHPMTRGDEMSRRDGQH